MIEDRTVKKKLNGVGIITVMIFTIVGVASYFLFNEPVEEVPVVEQGPVYCEGEWRSYVCSKEWEDKIAISIMICESNEDPNAFRYEDNGTVSFSLFQINSVHLAHYDLKDIADPYKNIDIAYDLWDKGDGVEGNGAGDWRLWSTFNDGCWYNYYIQLGTLGVQDDTN